jgi:hypothetical protein
MCVRRVYKCVSRRSRVRSRCSIRRDGPPPPTNNQQHGVCVHREPGEKNKPRHRQSGRRYMAYAWGLLLGWADAAGVPGNDGGP